MWEIMWPSAPASDATRCNIHWKPIITHSLRDALEIGLICATICTLPIRKICAIYSTKQKRKKTNSQFFCQKNDNFFEKIIILSEVDCCYFCSLTPKNMQKQDELARLRLMHITGESAHNVCMWLLLYVSKYWSVHLWNNGWCFKLTLHLC
jgi:hypothetical protein